MSSAYAVWVDQEVILRVCAGDLRVSLRGKIVSETEQAVRLRLAGGWDVDVFKSMILAVEEDPHLEDSIT